ncbi:MAG TPA: L-threonylcarbamoyladenylate synthase [Saprospiraceae bacterium]|nr:L-threonylcarbamoyladenylate synthase [Saprospiraceae bacterium]
MLYTINPENPQQRKVDQVVDVLKKDGVVIYPSDTIYALGCSIYSSKGLERVCRIRGIKPKEANFSFICKDISEVSEFTRPIPNPHFKLMKRLTPGPYTFILNANNTLPKLFQNKKKTIGIRIQNTPVVHQLLEGLGHPLLSASLRNDDEITEYYTDASVIYDDFNKLVDVVIDGGAGENIPSTVIDLTGDEPVVLREGLGTIEW